MVPRGYALLTKALESILNRIVDLRIDPETGSEYGKAAEVEHWIVQLQPLNQRAGRPRVIRDRQGPIKLRNDSTDEHVWDEVKLAEAAGEEVEGRRIIACGINQKGDTIIKRDVDAPPDETFTIKPKSVQEEALQLQARATIKAMKQLGAVCLGLAKSLAETRGVTIVRGNDVVTEQDDDFEKMVKKGAREFFAGIAGEVKAATANGTTNGHAKE